jgi:hypothetical protein
MTEKTRKTAPRPWPAPTPSPAPLDDDPPGDEPLDGDAPMERVMKVACWGKGEPVPIWVEGGDENTWRAALDGSQGEEAVTRHLCEIDLDDLLGHRRVMADAVNRGEDVPRPDEAVRNNTPAMAPAFIRGADVRRLGEAVRNNAPAEVLTLMLAESVIHALIAARLSRENRVRITRKQGYEDKRQRLVRARNCDTVKSNKDAALLKAIQFELDHWTDPHTAPTPQDILNALLKRDDAEQLVYHWRDGKWGPLKVGTIRNKMSLLRNTPPQ